jgi:hypothetical protein
MTTAQGNFSESEYQLNTSLAEANTIRVYSFAKSTGELVQLQIDFVVNGKPTTVIVSESITYNEPLTAEALSEKDLSQISFQTATAPATSKSHPLIGISADKAAKIILQAMKEWDEEILGTAMHYYKGDVMKVVESRYRGLEVKSIEKSVSSGLYPGRFVKCKVVLADGSAKVYGVVAGDSDGGVVKVLKVTPDMIFETVTTVAPATKGAKIAIDSSEKVTASAPASGKFGAIMVDNRGAAAGGLVEISFEN